MKKTLIGAAAVALGITGALAFISTAQATEIHSNPCKIEGFYVNPDEKDYEPTRTEDGFLFEGKDLIHHATSLDFPDVKVHTLKFEDTTAGKVQGKMETSNPYSTINQNPDGKFWSTAMLYDQEGGQGKPVENVADLIGKDVKPGKMKYNDTSKVVSFGVGYVAETGSTTVTSITFHGTKYDFTCKATPTASPTPTVTATPTTTATATPTATATATASPTKQPTATASPTKTATATASPTKTTATASQSPVSAALPVTGDGGGVNKPLVFTAGGVALIAAGAVILLALRRRRDAVEFTA